MYYNIVLLGIIVSLIYTELTGLSPAGLIVPGYFVLCLQNPTRIIYTMGIVLLSFLGVKLLNRFTILYGRRQFAVLILLSFALNYIIVYFRLIPDNPGIIGSLIPGIIANEFIKQGVIKSSVSLIIVTSILALVLMWNGIGVLPI
ncbi:MAG: poly-gamma-glutamate biosynthesis protein PgsC [Candidatus Fimivivens sp.]